MGAAAAGPERASERGRRRRGPTGTDHRARAGRGCSQGARGGAPVGCGGYARAPRSPWSQGGSGDGGAAAGEGARGGAAERGPPPAPAILSLPGPGSPAPKPRPPRARPLARLDESPALGGPRRAPGFPFDRQAGRPISARISAPSPSPLLSPRPVPSVPSVPRPLALAFSVRAGLRVSLWCARPLSLIPGRAGGDVSLLLPFGGRRRGDRPGRGAPLKGRGPGRRGRGEGGSSPGLPSLQ